MSEEQGENIIVADRSWVQVQIKAFTAWINQTLALRKKYVNDISTDLSNGVNLINFFELLCSKKLKAKYDENPKNRIKQIQNVHLALLFLEKEMEVPNPGISAEEIVDTNLKLVLGLLWTLFRKYRISVISEEDKSSEEGLLLWCKNITEGYKNVHIDKWKNSFRDGMAFLAMVHRYNPEKTALRYEDYSQGNPKDNLLAAFEFAETEMGVPKLLEPQEVIEGTVDERSLVLYTSLFFHAFNAAKDRAQWEAEQRNKQEQLEAERIKKAKLAEDNAKLIERVEELEETYRLVVLERDGLVSEKQNLILEKNEMSIEKQELEEKSKLAQDTVDVMKQLLEAETEEKTDLDTSKKQLEQEISELKTRLEIELGAKSKSETDLTEKLNEETNKAKKLQKIQHSLEGEIEDFKAQVEDLKVKLEKEVKSRKEKDGEVEEHTERSKVQLSGLSVLKRNLDQHLDDLHRWQKYLEYDKKATLDFEVEVKGPLQDDLEKKSFKEQLDILSSKLDEENEAMLKILKQKEVEAKASAALAKKKKKDSK